MPVSRSPGSHPSAPQLSGPPPGRSAGGRRRRVPLRPLLLAGLAVLSLAASLQQGAAQEGATRLTFGLSQSLSRTSNPGLTVPAEDATLRADTGLSLGFISETPLQQLSLQTGALLRGARDRHGDFRFELKDPSASLGYRRLGATSSFSLSAFHRESDLDERLLLGFDEDDNLQLFYEQGRIRTSGGRIGYTWGDGLPLGGSLGLSGVKSGYSGTTDPTLVDNRTLTASIGLHAALDERTSLTLDLSGRRYSREGAGFEDETSGSLGLGVSRELPAGRIWARLTRSHDQDGTRHGLSFGRQFELPDGNLSVELGMSRSPEGKTEGTGALSYGKELAQGNLSLRLSRGLSHDSSNQVTMLTALALGWQQPLTELLGLNLSARWSRSEVTSTGLATDTGLLDAGLSWRLTEDWGLNLGATHRLRDSDSEGRASSNGVYLSLARSFEWRP